MRLLGVLFTGCLAACGLRAADLDLRGATVYAALDFTGPQKKAVEMLVSEVEARTRLRLPISTTAPPAGRPAIRIARAASGPREGYRLRVEGSAVHVEGNDARGVLYGVGALLRRLYMDTDKLTVDPALNITTAPQYALRGHQLGYRPKTNSYDGWTLAMWEQYIRDLAVFGANAIELMPPRTDDDADSPHFPMSQMDGMIGMSRIANDYGLDVWVWYPALDKDYSDPATVESAVREWAGVLSKLPRVDAVFVPGGDPGHTHPRLLMAMLEKQAASLRKHHPKMQMWVAPQSFDAGWMEEFYAIVRREPAWLNGVVYGPQSRVTLAGLRAAIPKKYPIRHYPDITHTIRAQYAVPDWDMAYALTLGREPINPRPVDQAAIFRLLQPMTVGFLTYSEGCNDDVNKFVWSGLGWNPDAKLEDILREYSRYFIGPRFEEGFAQGLLALERNWRGPLIANTGVETTLQQFRAIEREATPRVKLNWRFQQALYRAYYDAYVRQRLIRETAAEQAAMDALSGASRKGSLAAMGEAEALLDRGRRPVAPDLRARVYELAEALFQSIRMQLSVERYQAIAVGRGANLDTVETPLNNRGWLKDRFAELRALPDEKARLLGIAGLLDYENPGPGGFYDDLGDPMRQPHLVRGAGYANDPEHQKSTLTAFAINPEGFAASWRTSWMSHAETRNDEPLTMRYQGLDPRSRYKVRVTYAGENLPVELRLTANGVEVHGFRKRDRPVRPVEFRIPVQAANGELTLRWERPAGLGGNGRGVQIGEVWLIREGPAGERPEPPGVRN